MEQKRTKNIAVNGLVFSCPVEWKVDQATVEIRSRFVLAGGGIDEDNVPLSSDKLIETTTGILSFAGGRPVQQDAGSYSKLVAPSTATFSVPGSGVKGMKSQPKDVLKKSFEQINGVRNNVGGSITFKVNNRRVGNADEFYELLSEGGMLDLEEIQTKLGSALAPSLEEGDVEKYGLVFSKEELHKLGEKKYQTILNKANEKAVKAGFLVCTSASNLRTPVVMTHDGNAFRFTAKCDLVSGVMPLAGEMKGIPHKKKFKKNNSKLKLSHEIFLLNQSLWRTYNMACLHGHLSSFFTIAFTSTQLHLVWFQRQWEVDHESKKKTLAECIHVICTDVDDLSTLWAMLTKAAVADPTCSFLAPDETAHISRLLVGMCGTAAFCRTVAVGASISTVYGVSFPQLEKETENDKTKLVVSKRDKQFAVKYVAKTDEFDREVRCIDSIWTRLRESNGADSVLAADDFYAIGHCRFDASKPVFASPYWEQYTERLTNLSRQALAMKKIPINKDSNAMSSSDVCGGGTMLEMEVESEGHEYAANEEDEEDEEDAEEADSGISLGDIDLGSTEDDVHGTELVIPWWQIPHATPSGGGLIIMRCADYKHGGVDIMKHHTEKVGEGIAASLRLMHSSSVLHCDVRPQNVLPFIPRKDFELFLKPEENTELPREWQLIDLSLGCAPLRPFHAQVVTNPASSVDAQGEVLTIYKSYGQYQHAGWRVQKAGEAANSEQFSYTWTIHDDFEMAYRLITRLLHK